MHAAIHNMLDRYECRTRDDYINALREILQDVALLGLWRSKFFEHAAFYGGTARREVAPFVRDQRALDVWSDDFFRQIMTRVSTI